jgi:hypothetical protein
MYKYLISIVSYFKALTKVIEMLQRMKYKTI